jgi:hypothetical protein
MTVLVQVESFEEEWRTHTRRVQGGLHGRQVRVSYGRACLWVRLQCGHHVQRMVTLDREGRFIEPVKARCSEC